MDASVAVKWFALSEADSDRAMALLQLHLDGSIRIEVLTLTPYEVGSATLSMGGAELTRAAAEALSGLGLSIQEPTLEIDLAAADLAHRHDLTFYDASYLASALARSAPLVTADTALLEAARAEGIGVALEDIPL